MVRAIFLASSIVIERVESDRLDLAVKQQACQGLLNLHSLVKLPIYKLFLSFADE